MTEENLHTNVLALLSDPSYSRAAQSVGRLLSDEIQSPLERAVFWSEYLIRNGGAKHMESPGKYLGFVKFFQIDLIIFILAVILVQLAILWKCSTCFLKRYLRRRRT